MEKDSISYKIIPIVWIYGILISIILYLVGLSQDVGTRYTMSFVLGLATTLFNFSLMSKAMRNSLLKPEGTRTRYLLVQQLLRYSIYIFILATVAFNNKFDIIFTFIGMLSVKVVMFVYILLKKEGNE